MIFLGDIHGNFRVIYDYLLKHKMIKDTNFIQVGDFGAGVYSREKFNDYMDRINKLLKANNNNLYAIRGNHDDPSYFDGTVKWSNIELVPDYSVRVLEDKTVLFIGGGISINRKVAKYWWPDEVIKFDWDVLSNFRNIDIVVTHSSPDFVYPYGVDAPIVNYFATNDKSLKADLIEERQNLTRMYHLLSENNKIEAYFYGHFHTFNTIKFNDTKFVLLDIDEFYEYKF